MHPPTTLVAGPRIACFRTRTHTRTFSPYSSLSVLCSQLRQPKQRSNVMTLSDLAPRFVSAHMLDALRPKLNFFGVLREALSYCLQLGRYAEGRCAAWLIGSFTIHVLRREGLLKEAGGPLLGAHNHAIACLKEHPTRFQLHLVVGLQPNS